MMNITVLTIFPEMIEPYLGFGMIRKALDEGHVRIEAVNIRDYAEGKHQVTDDKPYGGGCGMVMKPEPLAASIKAARKHCKDARVIHMTPQGRPFNQEIARELSCLNGLILVCGRYEGIDERVVSGYVDDEISIGDYVLTGGELAALVITDAVTRLIPGVLGGEESAEKDSFSSHFLEHAHYTRPALFEGEHVPDVLVSGNHALIDKWRTETSLIRTFLKRPDLLDDVQFDAEHHSILKKWRNRLDLLIRQNSV